MHNNNIGTEFENSYVCIIGNSEMCQIRFRFRIFHHFRNPKLICPISIFLALSPDGPFKGGGCLCDGVKGGGGDFV